MKKIKLIFGTISVFGIVCFSALAGYALYAPLNNIDGEQEIEEANLSTKDLQENIEKEVSSTQVDKVTPSTKMVYEYYYTGDNVTESYEDVPPYFLIDLTREQMEQQFEDWTVKSFSSKEVVMQMVIDGDSSQYYIIGDYEGYVAVYYEKEINGTRLKDITNTPISSLPEAEQEEIKNGIKIFGEEKLIEYISNYES